MILNKMLHQNNSKTTLYGVCRLCCTLGLSVLFVLCVMPCAKAESTTLARPDGSTLHWALDRPAGAGHIPIAILAQGSGCAPASKSKAIALAKSVFSDFAVVTVEKYGVQPDSQEQGCSQDFYRRNTVSQRVQDYLQVLETLKRSPWWNGRLLILGGSAGAEVAVRLAAPAHADAAILISLGGGRIFAEDMRDSILASAGCADKTGPDCPDTKQIFQHIKDNPHSTDIMGGESFAYWADILESRAVDYLLDNSVPILLVHGSQDDSVPVVSARKAIEILDKSGRCHVTYWEQLGYDHHMHDAQGHDHLPDILSLAKNWVALTWSAEHAMPDCQTAITDVSLSSQNLEN